jgi:diguanylate cyclase (GGDEF)-like protein
MTASAIENDPQYLRTDLLTGIGNPLAFFEWLQRFTEQKPIPPFTLISLDIMNLTLLNDTHGRSAGDAAIRWATLVLLEETEASVYRISGDEFVGVLTRGSQDEHEKLGEKVYHRLNQEADLVMLDPPVASLGLIHFADLEKISAEDVLGVIYGALVDVKTDQDRSFKVLDAGSTKPVDPKSGLINDMVRRMVSLGSMLDNSQSLAYTDPISGLPNMRAAMAECESIIKTSSSNDQMFCILLIDGDDLGSYNKIGYLAGDEMIARLGDVLSDEMRPGDFVARWRFGDEFLILLRETSPDLAVSIADRLRESVITASQGWIKPITISIDVAGYPSQGSSIPELINRAEQALSHAKELGKNQVSLSR